MTVRHALLLIIIPTIVAATTWAQDAPATKPAAKAKSGSLDDELLKELGESKSAPKAEKPTTPATAPKRAGSALDDELLKELGEKPTKPKASEPTATASGEGPVAELTRKMRDVESRLRQARRDEQTHKVQDQIVKDLDALLKQMQQQQSGKGSKSSSSPPGMAQRPGTPQPGGEKRGEGGDQPARESSGELKSRQAAAVDLAKMREMLKDVWGQLPPKLREQMLQTGEEKFLPKYELLLEEYFKTLADRPREGR